jgi:hypothetical protein
MSRRHKRWGGSGRPPNKKLEHMMKTAYLKTNLNRPDCRVACDFV